MANFFEQFLDSPGGGGGGGEEQPRQSNYFEQFLDQPPQPPPQQPRRNEAEPPPKQQNYFAQFTDQPAEPTLPKVDPRDSSAYRNEPWPDTAEGFKKKFGDSPSTDTEIQKYKIPDEYINPAEGMLATGARAAAHTVGPMALATRGAYTGGAALAPFGPWAAAGGALAGGVIGYFGGSIAQESALRAMGFDDSQQMAVNAKVNPKSALAGEIAGSLPFAGVGAASAGVRAAGAGIGATLEAGSQYFGDQELDTGRIAGAAGAGALLTRPTALAETIGGRAAKTLQHWHGAGASDTAGTASERPPPRGQPADEATPQTRVDSLDPQVFHGEGDAPATPAARTPPPPIEPDPAIAAAIRREPIQPQVTPGEEVPLAPHGTEPPVGAEPPTRYGPALDAEFPRIPNAEEQARPLRPEMEPVAPQTPREALAQRAPDETVGGALRRFIADERGGARLPSRRPPLSDADLRAAEQDALQRFNEAGAKAEDARTSPEVASAKARLEAIRRELLSRRTEAQKGMEPVPDAAAGVAPAEAMPTPRAFEGEAAPGREPNFAAALEQRGFTPEEIRAMPPERVQEILQKRQGEVGSQAPAAEAPVVPPAAAGAPPIPPGAPPPGAPPPTAGAPPPPPPPTSPPLQAATPKDQSNTLWDSIVRTFAPEVRPSGKQGMDVFRKAAGLMDRMYQTQKARFTDDVWKSVNEMSEMDQRKFINYIQGGKELQTPGHDIHDPNWAPSSKLQAAADDLKRNFQEWEKEISSWPQAMKAKFRENFLNQEWKELRTEGQRGGGVGGRGHLKERVFENDEAGRAAGYTPTTTNPLERWNNYALAMGHTAVEFKTQTALENMGAVGWFSKSNPNVTGGPPKGYAPVVGWERPGGAQAYAPADMAALLNNQFAAHGGFRTAETQNIVDKLRRFKNFSTAMELATSLYHPFTTAFEATASGINRSLAQVGAGPGWAQRASKSFLQAWVDPISHTMPEWARQKLNLPESFGNEWIERYKGQRPSTPEQKKIMDVLTEAGIRPVGTDHAMDYEISRLGGKGTFTESWRRGSLGQEMRDAGQSLKTREAPQVAVNVAGRILQETSAPIFQSYIPRLKMMSLVRDVQAFMASNPGATQEQLVDIARKFSSSTDNRIGEMISDHMGMNKVAKQIINGLMRSFSFTVGPLKEFPGGIAAPFKGAIQGAKTDGLLGAIKGANTLTMSSDSYNPKTGYALAYGIQLGLIGAAINYVRTGEWPQEWRDFVTPKTGGMVMSGGQVVPERMLLPGYHKDALGYAFHPLDELRAKTSAPVSAIMEQFTGKDYRGDPIAPPASAAGLGAHVMGRVGNAASRLLPISVKQMSDTPKTGSNISLPERALGFRAPGAYMLNPERIEQVHDIVDRKAWRTKERHEAADRRARGLPAEPPMKFENEPEKLPRKRQRQGD